MTTAWYPNRKVAGDGVFVQKHAQAIAALHDVAVLMVQSDAAIRGWRVEIEATLQDIPNHPKASLKEVLVYVPKIGREIPLLTGLLRLIWLAVGNMKGYRYIQKNYWQGQRPDLCHVNVLTRAAGLPWVLSKVHHIPYIITEHWSRYHRAGAFPSGRLHLWFTRRVVRDAAYVCPVSLNLERSMKQWRLDNPRYVRVGNVVFPMPALAESSALRERRPAQRASFVHVSWMRDDSKNISGILRALSVLAKERQDWHMDFIGEGNDKEQLMSYAVELGLSGHADPAEHGHADPSQDLVSFLPAQDSAQLAQSLARYDALVMFSHFENQPVSVLEALAAGLPVIATSVGEIPKMLAHNRGITVEPGNEQQLLEVLRAFVSLIGTQRQDFSLRQQRHQYVVDHHSAEVIARQFDVLYHMENKGQGI